LRIEEHYTDTAGFTDHVFGLMPFVGFRFAPRIRDLGETKLFVPPGDAVYDGLKPMLSGERLKIKQIRAHWDEILRLTTASRSHELFSQKTDRTERATSDFSGCPRGQGWPRVRKRRGAPPARPFQPF
jgi:TnpA family transposase